MAHSRTYLALLLCLSLAPGCRRREQETPPPQDGAAAAPTKDEERRRNALDYEKSFDELRGQLARSPDPLPQKLRKLRLFAENARRAEEILAYPIPAVKRAEKEMEALKKAQEDEAGKELEKIQAQVTSLLEASPPGLSAARELLDGFPQRLKDTEAAGRLEELRARIQLHEEADMQVTFLKTRLGREEDPVKIIAALEGFDPRFDGTPAARDVETLIRENYQKYVERRESAVAASKEARWVDLDLEQYVPLWHAEDSISIKFEDGVLVVGPNDAAYVAQDNADLNLAAGTCIRLGQPSWLDVEIHFEAQVTAGEGIFLGARGFDGPRGYNFNWVGLGELGISDQEWHNCVVRIEGGSFLITDATGKGMARNTRIRTQPGPFGIRVTGAKAVIRLRNMKVWVKKREGATEEEEAKKASKKKKKKKSSKPEKDKE